MIFIQVNIGHYGTIANIALLDLDLRFQCQTFSCYALAKQNVNSADGPPDLPRVGRRPWSCSCRKTRIERFSRLRPSRP